MQPGQGQRPGRPTDPEWVAHPKVPMKAATQQEVIVKIDVDKATFDAMHAADRMATDKLKEGIEGFSAALVKLESLLANRLAELEQKQPASV